MKNTITELKQSRRALDTAIRVFKSQNKLAKALAERTGLNIRQGHVWAWRNRYVMPAAIALAIEALCAERGFDVPREALCPGHPFDVPRPVVRRAA